MLGTKMGGQACNDPEGHNHVVMIFICTKRMENLGIQNMKSFVKHFIWFPH